MPLTPPPPFRFVNKRSGKECRILVPVDGAAFWNHLDTIIVQRYSAISFTARSLCRGLTLRKLPLVTRTSLA